MPTARYFAQCPPFPPEVAIADIPIVSLKRLEEDRDKESVHLFQSCCSSGVFLLDLQDSPQGRTLLKDAEGMFDLTKAVFDLGKTVLDEYAYDPPKNLLGYKAAGMSKVADGKADTTEMYTLGQDDMLGTVPPRRNPGSIELSRSSCHDFLERAHAVLAVILGALDLQLGLPEGSLADRCSLKRLSATSLRLLLTRPQMDPERVTLGAHTDIGLMTLLFNVAGGLQILTGTEEIESNWRFVRPQQGCVLVNVADTLAEWTGGLLKSVLHRVVASPGAQSSIARFSMAYLVRPAHGEHMRRLRGSMIPIPAEGEDDDRTVDEYAADRAAQIIQGTSRPRPRGSVPVKAA